MPLIPWRSGDQGNHNWRHLWETNRKSHLQPVRTWLQRLSSSPSSPIAPSIPPPTSNSSKVVAMLNNPMIQSLEDQFLYWHQDMEKKQEEHARRMKELQDHVECLQRENDWLRSRVEKIRDLGGKYLQDSGRALHPVPRNRGKEPIIPDEVDAPTDDELSSGSFPPLGLSPTKNTRAKSRKRTSHLPAFNNTVSGASHWARREADKG